MTIAALVGHAKGSVTSKYIHTLDTALIIAADTISNYIQGLLDGIEFKQTAYALDRQLQERPPWPVSFTGLQVVIKRWPRRSAV